MKVQNSTFCYIVETYRLVMIDHNQNKVSLGERTLKKINYLKNVTTPHEESS